MWILVYNTILDKRHDKRYKIRKMRFRLNILSKKITNVYTYVS